MRGTNIKIVLQYDGTRYDGWQKQGNTDRTIQGRLERILERMTGQPVEVYGSGRTDAGVHALRQTANFYLPPDSQGKEWTPEAARDALNRYLPEDIAVLEAEHVPERFHSRLHAVSKTYLYRIETAKRADVFQRKYVYILGQMNHYHIRIIYLDNIRISDYNCLKHNKIQYFRSQRYV